MVFSMLRLNQENVEIKSILRFLQKYRRTEKECSESQCDSDRIFSRI